MSIEHQYKELLRKILKEGVSVSNRTGIDSLSIFAANLSHDLSEGFPAFTSRKLAFKTMFHELIWLLRGNSNVKYLQDNGVKIWDAWADSNGDIGPSYPTQWRAYPDYSGGSVDQIKNVIEGLKKSPTSRRHIVCAWNPAMESQMVLPPCHSFFAFYADDGKLSCHLTQRSGDVPLGIFFNVPSYALLTHLIAKIVGMPVGVFHHTIINAHIYENQIEGVKEYLDRDELALPELWLDPSLEDIDDVNIESARLVDYNYIKPQIKFPVAV
jgi:thymidylate synthase